MYEQGADIVMNVASATGNGVLESAKENNRVFIDIGEFSHFCEQGSGGAGKE
ncbi:hypothetical protein FACS1894161_5390 [Spirochaetia bacterium]|nr:hypothetical protein FACS1894161_5390 [Spirochaetia bacterium]